MFDPAQVTLGQVSSALRDLAIFGVLITVSWKSRGLYEAAKQFFQRLTTHMDVMEAGMNTLLTNHLAHIEDYVKLMSDNQERVLSGDEVIHTAVDEGTSKK